MGDSGLLAIRSPCIADSPVFRKPEMVWSVKQQSAKNCLHSQFFRHQQLKSTTEERLVQQNVQFSNKMLSNVVKLMRKYQEVSYDKMFDFRKKEKNKDTF